MIKPAAASSTRTIGRTLLLAAALVGAVWLGVRLWPVIVCCLVALIVVGTVNPLTRALAARGLGRTTSIALVFLGIAGGLVLVGLLTVPALVTQVRELLEGAPAMQQQLAERLGRSHLTLPLANAVRNAKLGELVPFSGRQAFEYSTEVVGTVGWALTSLALAFYILADPSSSQAALYGLVPRRFHLRLARVLLKLETIVGGYMRGQLITSALMGLFTYVLLRLCGIRNPLPLAIFAGVADVLPLIGGILSAIPLVIAALPHGKVIVAVVVVAAVVYQEIENRLIIPRVYGRVLRLPAWAITVALLAGAELMGMLGALLSLPVAAGLRMMLEELRVALPGDGTVDPGLRERDRRVEALFSELAAEAGPRTAAAIALNIASSDAPDVPLADGRTEKEIPLVGKLRR